MFDDHDDEFLRGRDTGVWPLIAIFLILALAVLLLSPLAGPRNDDQDEYCRMVAAYRHDPATGWPDFHHTYDNECTGDHAK